MKERGPRQQRAGPERVGPGADCEAVLLAITVANARGLLVGIVWYLIEIASEAAIEAELILRRLVEDERREAATAAARVVQILECRGGERIICAVAIAARIPCESLRMIAQTDLIVGCVVRSVAGDQFGLSLPFKTRARCNVEDSVGAVPVVCAVAASTRLHIVHVFWIELRSHIG